MRYSTFCATALIAAYILCSEINCLGRFSDHSVHDDETVQPATDKKRSTKWMRPDKPVPSDQNGVNTNLMELPKEFEHLREADLALYDAVLREDRIAVEAALEAQPTSCLAFLPNGCTPFGVAAYLGNRELAELLDPRVVLSTDASADPKLREALRHMFDKAISLAINGYAFSSMMFQQLGGAVLPAPAIPLFGIGSHEQDKLQAEMEGIKPKKLSSKLRFLKPWVNATFYLDRDALNTRAGQHAAILRMAYSAGGRPQRRDVILAASLVWAEGVQAIHPPRSSSEKNPLLPEGKSRRKRRRSASFGAASGVVSADDPRYAKPVPGVKIDPVQQHFERLSPIAYALIEISHLRTIFGRLSVTDMAHNVTSAKALHTIYRFVGLQDAHPGFKNVQLSIESALHSFDAWVYRVVESLLIAGNHPSPTSDQFPAPLQLAVSAGLFNTTRLLLSYGADPNLFMDQFDRSPLHMAAIAGYGELYEVLLRAGADPTTKDKWGRTPQDLVDLSLDKTLHAFLATGTDEDRAPQTPLTASVEADGTNSGASTSSIGRPARVNVTFPDCSDRWSAVPYPYHQDTKLDWVRYPQGYTACAALHDSVVGSREKKWAPLAVSPDTVARLSHGVLYSQQTCHVDAAGVQHGDCTDPFMQSVIGVTPGIPSLGDVSDELSQRFGRCDIPQVRAEDLTLESFVSDYFAIHRPVMIRGGAAHLPALTRWTRQYLHNRTRTLQTEVSPLPFGTDYGYGETAKQTTLAAFIKQFTGSPRPKSNPIASSEEAINGAANHPRHLSTQLGGDTDHVLCRAICQAHGDFVRTCAGQPGSTTPALGLMDIVSAPEAASYLSGPCRGSSCSFRMGWETSEETEREAVAMVQAVDLSAFEGPSVAMQPVSFKEQLKGLNKDRPRLKIFEGNKYIPQSEVLQVGAPLAGVSMHSVEHEWSTVVTGSKFWWLMPYRWASFSRQHPFSYSTAYWAAVHDRIRGKAATSSDRVAAVSQTRKYQKPDGRARAAAAEARASKVTPLMCTQYPGDVLYVPTQWGQASVNLQDTVTITEEFFLDLA